MLAPANSPTNNVTVELQDLEKNAAEVEVKVLSNESTQNRSPGDTHTVDKPRSESHGLPDNVDNGPIEGTRARPSRQQSVPTNIVNTNTAIITKYVQYQYRGILADHRSHSP